MNLSLVQAITLGIAAGVGWEIGKYFTEGLWSLCRWSLERYRAYKSRKAWEALLAQDTPFARAARQMADAFAQAFGPRKGPPPANPNAN